MAQNSFTCLHGTSVKLDGKTGPFRECPYDGALTGTVNFIGGNPHHAQITCATCGMHVSWLGRDHLQAMMATHGKGEAA